MFHPSGDEPKNGAGNRYALVTAVAKRAKQLRDGAPKLVESRSRNPITIALEEIAAGKLKIVIPTPEELEAAGREIAVRPERIGAAELVKIPEQEEPVEAVAAEAESVPPEASTELEEAEVSAEAEEQPQMVVESGEEEPVEAVAAEVESEEVLPEASAEASAEAEEQPQTAEIGEKKSRRKSRPI